MAVGYSNREAAHAMTLELIGAGYRRIVFVNGPSENNERARHAPEGYRAAMAEAGLAPLPIACRPRRGAILPETGARGAARARRRRAGDRGGLLHQRRLRRRRHPRLPRDGIAVPEPLGIAGFHDLEIGRIVTPTLTTVHVPALEIGREAGRDDPVAARRAKPAATGANSPFTIVARESTQRHAG